MLDHIQLKIDDDCTLSLRNLQAEISDTFNVDVSPSTIDRAIDGFKYSLKRIQNIAIAADAPGNEVKRTES